MISFFQKLILINSLILITFSATAQKEADKPKSDKDQEKPEPSKLVFGGNFGLEIGSITFIDISPTVGYYFRPRLLYGLGATYQYLNERYLFTGTHDENVSSNIFGFRTFAIYTIFDNIGKSLTMKQNFGIFVQAEYEALNLDHDFSNTSTNERVNRFWLNGILLGGGLKQTIGKRSSFNISILFNILANKKTPYDNPVVRIGFFF